MKSVATLFGKRERSKPEFVAYSWPLPEQLTGVEVEVESVGDTIHPYNLEPYWKRVSDGSLIHGGSEYILSRPLCGEELSTAISELFRGANLERAVTGSTHVHIDMQEPTTTPNMVKTLLLLVFMLEDAVFKIADPGREWCGYTNKLSTAPDCLLGSILNSSEDEDDLLDMQSMCSLNGNGNEVGRYYGLNFMALAEHGSVEFRYFPTATSVEELYGWVSLCHSFKKAASELASPERLYQVMSTEESYVQFIHAYFNQWRDDFLLVVPYYLASHNLRKALAVASSYSVSLGPISKFDPKSITDNKVLAKFIKKKADSATEGRILEPVFLTSQQGAPPATSHLPGTLMFAANGVVYINSGGRWELDRWSSLGATVVANGKATAQHILAEGFPRDRNYSNTAIGEFLYQLRNIVDMHTRHEEYVIETVPRNGLRKMKKKQRSVQQPAANIYAALASQTITSTNLSSAPYTASEFAAVFNQLIDNAPAMQSHYTSGGGN